MVYLLHFTPPYKHARHYMGSSDNVEERVRLHQAGQGARLAEVAVEHGVQLELVRTWEGGRDLERQLKQWHDSPSLCPRCNPNALRRANGRIRRAKRNL